MWDEAGLYARPRLECVGKHACVTWASSFTCYLAAHPPTASYEFPFTLMLITFTFYGTLFVSSKACSGFEINPSILLIATVAAIHTQYRQRLLLSASVCIC